MRNLLFELAHNCLVTRDTAEQLPRTRICVWQPTYKSHRA